MAISKWRMDALSCVYSFSLTRSSSNCFCRFNHKSALAQFRQFEKIRPQNLKMKKSVKKRQFLPDLILIIYAWGVE
jgi:hypothetical protein